MLHKCSTNSVSDQPTWSLVVTTKAPAVFVKCFIAHHLLLGAKELWVFFDDPQDVAFDVVNAIPGVRAFRCDQNHWAQSESGRPPTVSKRQMFNANLALRHSQTDWLGHIDMDEFLHPLTPLAEMLASVASHVQTVRLPPCEKVFPHPPTVFRDTLTGPFKKALGQNQDGWMANVLLHGDIAQYFPAALQGHFAGKIFLRKGTDLQFWNNHYAGYPVELEVPDLEHPKLQFEVNARSLALPAQQDSVVLLHFFVWSYGDWCGKYLRRLAPEQFAAANGFNRKKWGLLREAATRGEAAVRALFSRANILTSTKAEVLERMNALVEVDLALEAKVRQVFGPGDHGFDDELPDMAFDELQRVLRSYTAAP